MDLSTASRGELIDLIYKQERQIELLKEALIELQEKIKQKTEGDDSSKIIPSFVKPNVKNPKRRKAVKKSREPGFARKREQPTQTIFHTFNECPNCDSSSLGTSSVAYLRQIVDIPLTVYSVTEHVIFKRYCFKCHNRVYPPVDLSSAVVGQGRVGLNLMAQIFTLRQEQNLSIHQIQDHLTTFYQLHLSLGEIVEVLHQEATLGQGEYEQIRKNILSAPAVYGDETGGRENGINGYWWNLSNQKFQLLLYRKSRGGKIVKEVLGEEGKNFAGVLISDFYTGYNEYLGPHQRCWVHFKREMKKLKAENPQDRQLKRWIKDIDSLYQAARSYPGPDPHLKVGLKETERTQQERYFKQRLRQLCEPYLKTTLPQAQLCARAMRYLPEMFSFIRFEEVNPDNNLAERAIRKTVIQRKISFGTRSRKGSETRAILGSLFGTWHLQHLNPFEQMRLLLLGASCQKV